MFRIFTQDGALVMSTVNVLTAAAHAVHALDTIECDTAQEREALDFEVQILVGEIDIEHCPVCGQPHHVCGCPH